MDIVAEKTLLQNGEFSNLRRIVDASNASIFCTLTHNELSGHAIYKPVAGERPLWDFEDGNLANREMASYLVDQTLGFNIVPTTILREGPYGIGALQIWIEDCEEQGDRFQGSSQKLRNIALLDVLINNTDRKIGHLLFKNEHIFGCDHGVTFHQEFKLRTVIWQFAGENLNDLELQALQHLEENIPGELANLINQIEFKAFKSRIYQLKKDRTFPFPSKEWPAIPWPPF